MRRLEPSSYTDNLILKGGLFLFVLSSFEAPEISTYSLESTVAEKLDAILERMGLTSRLKDYYDLYFIATTIDFDGRVLQEAIMETLQNRGTVYDASSFARILSFSNNTDMCQLSLKRRCFAERCMLSV